MPEIAETEVIETASAAAEAVDVAGEVTRVLEKHTPSGDAKDKLRETLANLRQIQRQLRGRIATKPALSPEVKAALAELVNRRIIKGSPRLQQPFEPKEAGREVQKQLAQAEGGAFTGSELEKNFNLTSATLHRRRKEHRIVYWRDAKHDFHYPQWQFSAAGALLRGIQEVLQTFRSNDEWRLMRYFLVPKRSLGGQRPLDLIRAGKADTVGEHARAQAEENTW